MFLMEMFRATWKSCAISFENKSFVVEFVAIAQGANVAATKIHLNLDENTKTLEH
jgi:hypothetical protein